MNRAKSNILIGWSHESLWGFAFGLIQPMTILPLALTDLGGSAAQAGLLAGLFGLGMNLPQAFSSFWLKPRWTDPRRLALLHAPAILGTYFLAALFFFPPSNPRLHLALFLGGIAWFFLWVGVTVPHWMVATTRCIDEKIRGRYFGVSFFLSGLLGIFTSHLAARWAEVGGLAWGYGAAFLLAAVFQTASASLITLWRPLRKAPAARKGPALPFLQSLLPPAQRRAWGTLALLSAALIAMNGASGIFTVDLRDAQGAAKSLFTFLAPAFSVGLMAGAFCMGWLSDRPGPRIALGTAVFAAVLGLGGVAFLPGNGSQVLSYFFSGYANNLFVAHMVVILALSGKSHPTIKIGIFSTLLAPVQFGMPLLAGLLAQRAGFGWAYGYSAAFTLLAAMLLLPNPLWRFLRK